MADAHAAAAQAAALLQRTGAIAAVGIGRAPATGARDAVVVGADARLVGLQRDASADEALSDRALRGPLVLSAEGEAMVARVRGDVAAVVEALLAHDAFVVTWEA